MTDERGARVLGFVFCSYVGLRVVMYFICDQRAPRTFSCSYSIHPFSLSPAISETTSLARQ